jgi:acetate kinase
MIVLTLNSGSSSLKFGLYRAEGTKIEPLMAGATTGGMLRAHNAQGSLLPGTPLPVRTSSATVAGIVSLLSDNALPAPDTVGHRIVHGGPKLQAHCLIDDAVERDLAAACALSPLHGPAAIEIIGLAKQAWPGVPQVACFDTAYHVAMPEIARTLPVSQALRAKGVRRYGFHGLSCASIMRQIVHDGGHRIIIAHLGSGASVTAVRDGRSIDTSMGLTPSGGVIMATRSGDIDPGVLIYLLRETGGDYAQLQDLVDHGSGLLGISDLSGDMQALHEAEDSNPHARLAIAMFCVSVAKQIAAMIVALKGVDCIVFTGGIGEHDAEVRTEIIASLGWLGLHIDVAANARGSNRIDAIDSRSQIRVLPSHEDEEIARNAAILVWERC